MNTLRSTQSQASSHVLSLLHTLIGFDTTSRESNLGLIEWVRDLLARQGVQSRLTYDRHSNKANLFATIGGGSRAGIVLSGHTDVVPVDGQDWATNPFDAVVRDGRLYGRGSCDMKGFIACALSAVPGMLTNASDTPFHLALSYDEEVGCLGVRSLLADLAEQDIRPAACIVGEPTEMQVVVAHKGRREMRCCVRGKEAHSSLPEFGVNAIEYGAQIIAFTQRLAKREARLGPRALGFSVPYNTLQCGTVRGGISANTIPKESEFSLEVRYLPGTQPEAIFNEIHDYIHTEVLPQMQSVFAETSVDLTLVNDTPAFEISLNSPLVRLVQRLSRAQRKVQVAYNTEAGLFQSYGIPTVICGPGSIEQAHRPNEYVDLEQIGQCEAFLARLTARSTAADRMEL